MKNKIDELLNNGWFVVPLITALVMLMHLLISHDFITVLLTIVIIATCLDIAFGSSSKEFKNESFLVKLSIVINKLLNDAGVAIMFFILGLMAK